MKDNTTYDQIDDAFFDGHSSNTYKSINAVIINKTNVFYDIIIDCCIVDIAYKHAHKYDGIKYRVRYCIIFKDYTDHALVMHMWKEIKMKFIARKTFIDRKNQNAYVVNSAAIKCSGNQDFIFHPDDRGITIGLNNVG